MSSTDFYRAFEDRHRGSRELIRARLQAYQPFIAPLPGIYQPAHAIDLGCGRGEWLELLQETGFTPQGVDLDAGMLAACTERGLPVVQGDALTYLQSLGDASQCLVSGFHIAEHLPFKDLETLVVQAFRVLKPGGLLILETPNPENLVVGTSNFYLDPTHVRPIPPLLLSFLPEHHGFSRIHTLRLQESPVLRQRSDISLMDVLGGVSPDYAVVAQKDADPELLARFDPVFAVQYGVALHELAGRFDDTLHRRIVTLDQLLAKMETQTGALTDTQNRLATLHERLLETATELARKQAECEQLKSRIIQISTRAEAAENQAHALKVHAQEQEQRAQEAENRVQSVQSTLIEVHQSNHSHWQLAETRLQTLVAVYSSWSWRLTAPLRWGGAIVLHPATSVRICANSLIHHSIQAFQRPLSRLMAVVLRRPQLSYRINQVLLRYPALYQQLLGVARRAGLVAGAQPMPYAHTPPTTRSVTPELINLPPRARQIYADLQKAIQNNKGSD